MSISSLKTNVTSLCSYKKLAGHDELMFPKAALIALSLLLPFAKRTIFFALMIVSIPIDIAFVG